MEFECLEETGKSYLIYKKEDNQEIDSVTLGMLENNEMSGVIPFYLRQEDNAVEFRYDVTGYESAQSIFNRGANRSQLLKFLKAIVEICKSCESYMIDVSQIVLDPKYIYMKKNAMDMHFVIIPLVIEDSGFYTQLKEMIFQLDFDRTENCSYVAELLNFFHHNIDFSLLEFSKMVRSIENSGGYQEHRQEHKQDQNVQREPERESRPVFLNQTVVPAAPEAKSYTKNSFAIPDVSEAEKIPEEKKKKGLFGFGKKKEKNNSKKSKLEIPKTESTKPSKKNAFGKIAIPGVENGGYSTGSFEIPKTEQTIKTQTVELQSYHVEEENFGETMLLMEETPVAMPKSDECKTHELIRVSTGERYTIVKPETKVGRKKTLVDICITGNIHVGRIHAVLYKDDDKIYIEDNGSTNGTFINESTERLLGKKQLYTGDQIKLGDEVLIVN